jgi:hypothetical protein
MQTHDDIDLSQLAIDAERGPVQRSRRPPRRVHGYFVRGPVPWVWIVAAARLQGKALHLGMAIWLRVGLTDALTVSISLTAIANELGFDRSTASRALSALARARLVSVEQAPGRNCSVSVLEVITKT